MEILEDILNTLRILDELSYEAYDKEEITKEYRKGYANGVRGAISIIKKIYGEKNESNT
jgi:hypothetical protein